jgi:hypothetical protein
MTMRNKLTEISIYWILRILQNKFDFDRFMMALESLPTKSHSYYTEDPYCLQTMPHTRLKKKNLAKCPRINHCCPAYSSNTALLVA